MGELWYTLTIDEVLAKLGANRNGLNNIDANQRIEKYSRNEIEEKSISKLKIFADQFKSLFVAIMIFATIIALILGNDIEAVVILILLVLSAGLGFYQENKAFNAVKSLKRMIKSDYNVIRDGEIKTIESGDIVPGDILLLKEGKKIPADCRIILSKNLKVNESILTGESEPVEKIESDIANVVPITERKNTLFAGTTVLSGKCQAVVIGTGVSTELGKISEMLQIEEEKTPLQVHLDKMSRDLVIILAIICGIIFIMGVFMGLGILPMLLVVLALAIAVLPTSLPAVVTITMTLGTERMAKRNAIVPKLSAVETLGSTTVICTDKTGTLTVNELTVRQMYVDNKIIDVTGEGFSEKGDFLINGEILNLDENPDIKLLLASGMMCNDAKINGDVSGDPTEIALLVAAKKANVQDLRDIYARTEEIPFDYNRRIMSTIYSIGDKRVAYVKGAFEEILKISTSVLSNGQITTLSQTEKKKLLAVNHRLSSQALRVIVVATKKLGAKEKFKEEELTLIGLFGMIDPPRKGVKESIEKCKDAGIKVVMLTGDHKHTAGAIAKELGIIDNLDEVIDASEIDNMSEGEFLKIVDRIGAYARATPEYKVKITQALKKKGHIVAMTGDGVNDAPALKAANIGIAMGDKGTDVAKDTADMILTDDNFSTIVTAVEEGRGIYDNIRKAIYFLLSCNFGEALIIFLATIIAAITVSPLILPLVPLQILWMNLLTDGLPAIALSVDPAEENIMKRKPRDPKEKILNKRSMSLILTISVVITIGTLAVFYRSLPFGSAYATTMAFTTLVMFEMFMVLGTKDCSIFKGKLNKMLIIAVLSSIALQAIVLYTPQLNPIFNTVPLGIMDWVIVLLVSISLLVILEIYKTFKNHGV